jgi:DNA-binding MarR family transcriptional regulator
MPHPNIAHHFGQKLARRRKGGLLFAPGRPEKALRIHTNVIQIRTQRDMMQLDRILEDALDNGGLHAYAFNMSIERHKLASTPCLCNALRQASRAVSRLYDEELRGVGLRTTQYSLLSILARAGHVRQGDLSGLTHLEETTLSRNLRPLVAVGWVSVQSGDDRREKLVTITEAGTAKLAKARPAWQRAQKRTQALLPEGAWHGLMAILPEVASLTADA